MLKKSFDEYIKNIPFKYRNKVKLIGKFKGNRSKVSFINIGCGCLKEYQLKVLLLRENFDVCGKCKSKLTKYGYNCKRCDKSFKYSDFYNKHLDRCNKKFNKLIYGEDYVECVICGYCAKSLGMHINKKHKIDIVEYKKNNKIICDNSFNKYSKQNIINTANFRKELKKRGHIYNEYIEKMSVSVRNAILANPEDSSRRAKVMSDVNKSDIMRKKASETAKKTSARKDIQEKRSKQLAEWRKNYPEDFYDKCIAKMLSSYNSKPETLLYELVKNHENYVFKRHRKVRSESFAPYKQRDIDIGDADKKIYIEYDGPLHFKETALKQLKTTQFKDELFNNHVIKQNWILIRISYDQFSYRKYDYGFKKECIDRIFYILNNPIPGIYFIGSAYVN